MFFYAACGLELNFNRFTWGTRRDENKVYAFHSLQSTQTQRVNALRLVVAFKNALSQKVPRHSLPRLRLPVHRHHNEDSF